MKEKNHFDRRTMHIDVGRRFYQKGDSGVAFKIIPLNKHKGMALSNKLKKEIKRDFHIDYFYARLYTICIYYLIEDELDSFDNLVICNDENYIYVKRTLQNCSKFSKRSLKRQNLAVLEIANFANRIIQTSLKKYLDLLFEGNDKYFSKFITSLSKLREISGDSKIRSYADNIANVYRRKALKSLRRKQRGIPLNIVEVNYQKIKRSLQNCLNFSKRSLKERNLAVSEAANFKNHVLEASRFSKGKSQSFAN